MYLCMYDIYEALSAGTAIHVYTYVCMYVCMYGISMKPSVPGLQYMYVNICIRMYVCMRMCVYI
jgi:hypothetical protein